MLYGILYNSKMPCISCKWIIVKTNSSCTLKYREKLPPQSIHECCKVTMGFLLPPLKLLYIQYVMASRYFARQLLTQRFSKYFFRDVEETKHSPFHGVIESVSWYNAPEVQMLAFIQLETRLPVELASKVSSHKLQLINSWLTGVHMTEIGRNLISCVSRHLTAVTKNNASLVCRNLLALIRQEGNKMNWCTSAVVFIMLIIYVFL